MRASLASVLFAASLVGGLAVLGGAFQAPDGESEARLQIASEPSGATILLDEKKVGKTPLSEKLTPGRHTVRFQLDGFSSEEHEVIWKDTQSQSLHQRLKPTSGSLTIKDLNKARIHLGPGIPQELEGKGPWKLAPGSYEITAVRGQVPARPKKIEIKPGESLEVALDWPALPVAPRLPQFRPPASPGPTAPYPTVPVALPPGPAYAAPRYNYYQPPRPTYRPAEPLFTPIPPAHEEPAPPPPPRTYPGGGEPIFTPLP